MYHLMYQLLGDHSITVNETRKLISVFLNYILFLSNWIMLDMFCILSNGVMAVKWLALSSHRKKVLGLYFTVCVDFACSPCFCVGFHFVFWLPRSVQRLAAFIK